VFVPSGSLGPVPVAGGSLRVDFVASGSRFVQCLRVERRTSARLLGRCLVDRLMAPATPFEWRVPDWPAVARLLVGRCFGGGRSLPTFTATQNQGQYS
jgi:hypothetical protein